jgi:thioredoxin reductase (NADPH)
MKKETHDLVIVGAGPAGLSAAIYAARYHIDFILIGQTPGGNMSDSYEVENYPGFEVPLHGSELGEKMLKQLSRFGHKPLIDNISAALKTKDGFTLQGDNAEYHGKFVLLALGTEKTKLGVPGETEFEGRGVAYCATCDGYFYRDKEVAVVGGGDSAAKAAIYLNDIARKVYLVVRKPELRAEPHCQIKVKDAPNVTVLCETKVKEIKGVDKVESIVLDPGDKEIKVDGVFIEVGHTPQTVLSKQLGIKTDDNDMIVVKGDQKTSVKGVWAAGDITTNSNGLRRYFYSIKEN